MVDIPPAGINAYPDIPPAGGSAPGEPTTAPPAYPDDEITGKGWKYSSVGKFYQTSFIPLDTLGHFF